MCEANIYGDLWCKRASVSPETFEGFCSGWLPPEDLPEATEDQAALQALEQREAEPLLSGIWGPFRTHFVFFNNKSSRDTGSQAVYNLYK